MRNTAPRSEGRRPWGAALLGLALLAPAACNSAPKEVPQGPGPLRGARIAFSDAPELAEIAQLEYARSTGGGRLQELAQHPQAEIRRRAVEALGRMPFVDEADLADGVTGALVRALEDEDPYVRRLGVFGLGLRGDLQAAGVLYAYRSDADPLMRMRVAEASRSLADPTLREAVLTLLRDTDLEVRIATVLAMAMWETEGTLAARVDRALLDVLLPSGAPGLEADPELRWRTLYSMQRRRAQIGQSAYLIYAGSQAPLERLFAVKGLANIDPAPETLAALASATQDPDWRVAVEALVGLGRHADPSTLPSVLDACEHESAHVRRKAFEALGGFEDPTRIVPKLTRGTRDVSSSAQAAALVALAQRLPSADALPHLKSHQTDSDAIVRAGVAEAAAHLSAADALPLLTRLVEDKHLTVAGTALSSLSSHPGPESRQLLHAALAHPDNGLRLWAILALRDMPDATDLEPLAEAMASARGDISPEVTFNALTNLAALGGPRAQTLTESALSHPDRHVRRVAATLLRDTYQLPEPPQPRPPVEDIPPVPLPGRDFPKWERNPIVEITTTRGTMVFELFPTEAPVHVHNFLTLAKEGHFDGLVFHRVVPDFVIQGGDYRGDGNGGQPWNGRSVPQEFTTRRYVRGSLGMPRNEDPDSAGSQLFVTHRPTPHLDGRYTVFGELREGGSVLDEVEVGDRILRVGSKD